MMSGFEVFLIGLEDLTMDAIKQRDLDKIDLYT